MSLVGRVTRGIACNALGGAIALLLGGTPARVEAQTAPLVLQSISVGSNHACGVNAQHQAWCWGRNAEGELGNTSVTTTCGEEAVPCSPKPVRVEGGLSFNTISAGNNYTCGISTGGAAYCWGLGSSGQLGTGSQASSRRPAKVGIEGVTFQSISAGHQHTCAVTTTGATYCWGSNAGGKLGTSASLTGGRTAPGAVAGRLSFRAVSAGYFHSCGVTRDGRTYCWGRNEMGEVGNGSTSASGTPVRVAANFAGAAVSAATQFDYSCAVAQDGTLYCWGANCYGQLAVDSTTEQCGTPAMPCSSSPKAAQGGGTYREVSASYSHACALTTSGALSCWGENNQGQLGNGTDGGRATTPSPVAGAGSYKALGVGRQFTCALTAEGAPQCWGRNAEGQLGTGDTANRNTPTAVVAP